MVRCSPQIGGGYATPELRSSIEYLNAKKSSKAVHFTRTSPPPPLLCTFTDLTIERFCMTGGESPIGYLKAYMTNLYLSKDAAKVTEAIEEGELYVCASRRFIGR